MKKKPGENEFVTVMTKCQILYTKASFKDESKYIVNFFVVPL